MKRNEKIKKILDDAHAQLNDLGVKSLLGAVDRKAGNVFIQADAKGEDLHVILDASCTNPQDVINLGVWVGKMIQQRKTVAIKNLNGKN